MKKEWLSSVWTPVLWSIIIFVLLIIPGQDFPAGPEIPLFDKIIHVLLFGVHVFLWCRYARRIDLQRPLWICVLIFLISCIYGIGMEYVQKYWVANRGFETGDMIADIIGSFCGWMIYRFFFLKKEEAL